MESGDLFDSHPQPPNRRCPVGCNSRAALEPALDAAFNTTADALIVHAAIGPEFAPLVQAAPLPLVLVDTMVPGAPSVCLDDRGGALDDLARGDLLDHARVERADRPARRG